MNKEKLLDMLLEFIRQLEGYEVFDNMRDYLVDFDDIDEQLNAALDHIKRFRDSFDMADSVIDFFKGQGVTDVMFDDIQLNRSDPKFTAALNDIIIMVETALL